MSIEGDLPARAGAIPAKAVILPPATGHLPGAALLLHRHRATAVMAEFDPPLPDQQEPVGTQLFHPHLAVLPGPLAKPALQGHQHGLAGPGHGGHARADKQGGEDGQGSARGHHGRWDEGLSPPWGAGLGGVRRAAKI